MRTFWAAAAAAVGSCVVWKQDGVVGGLVEISMEIPGEMPHYMRK